MGWAARNARKHPTPKACVECFGTNLALQQFTTGRWVCDRCAETLGYLDFQPSLRPDALAAGKNRP